MQTGKIILASAAALVTIGSNLAFKTAKKFGVKNAFVQVTPTTCHQCINAWTLVAGAATKCQTHTGGAFHLGGNANHRLFFRLADTPQTTCLQPTRATVVN